MSINAGLDVNIGKVLPLYLGPAIAAGYTTEQAVRASLRLLLCFRCQWPCICVCV